MRLKITAADIKRGKLLKPDWYVLEITEVTEEPNKKQDATNIVIKFVGLSGLAEGVPFTIWISEKAPAILGFPLLKALGYPVTEDEGCEVDFDESALVGKKVRAKVVNGMYNNKPNNQIENFAPAVTS